MYFDWKRFCDQRRIPYVTKGPNTARNHISIRCPMCGQNDPSQHLGLNLDPHHPVWGCFRNAGHRGANPAFLVREILGCSMEYARTLVDAQRPELDEFSSVMESLSMSNEEAVLDEEEVSWWARAELEMPACFPALTFKQSRYAGLFTSYLHSRGFENSPYVAQGFKMRYCMQGQFKYRLILPFYHRTRLVGWTGRTISPDVQLRYLTLPSDAEAAKRLHVPPALTDPGSYIMQQDKVEDGGHALLMVEGPLDWLKLQWFRHECVDSAPKPGGGLSPVVVSCWFGKPKEGQLQLVARCLGGFEKCFIMLDSDAQSEAIGYAVQLQELSGGVPVSVLSPSEFGAPDPGALGKEEVKKVFQAVLTRRR